MIRPNQHQFFIVRSWREGSDANDDASWRFVLEGPTANRRKGFSDLASLLRVLEEELRRHREQYDEAVNQSQSEEELSQ